MLYRAALVVRKEGDWVVVVVPVVVVVVLVVVLVGVVVVVGILLLLLLLCLRKLDLRFVMGLIELILGTNRTLGIKASCWGWIIVVEGGKIVVAVV